MTAVDTSYVADETPVVAHHHAWHAWSGDRVWRCTNPQCGAWISRLVDADGKVIPLPKDTDQ